MKNRITILYLLFFSTLIQAQVIISNGVVVQEEEKSTTTLQSRTSSTSINDGDPPLFDEPSLSVIDNISIGTINKVAGKVNYTIPITEITTNRLTVGINLNFKGANAIKYVDYSNKVKATGIVGLGWSINTSKIVSDNKQTGYRDDDEFFLLENGLKKLVCTKKVSTNLYEFRVENLPNWKVTYHRNNNYWTIVKENGDSYFYGDSDTNVITNANENVIRWNNWIGDSRATGGTLQTSAWNLSKISNQWNDKIHFFYETTDQSVQANNLGPKHTEASYLVKVEADSGERIEFNYLNKVNTSVIQEYYEPHTEINEPDAYQERYEKKYLDNIILKRNDSQQLTKHQLDYEVYGTGLLSKRHLTKVTTYNSSNESLNPQSFEYNVSGEFKGTIHKVKNTTGSEVTYQYENKFLFKNTPISFNAQNYPYSDNIPTAKHDNFFLQYRISQEKEESSIYSYITKGNSIKAELAPFDYYDYHHSNFERMISGENFYGLIHNNIIQLAVLNKDGNSWSYQKYTLPVNLPNWADWKSYIKYLVQEDRIFAIIKGTKELIPLVYNGKNFTKHNTINLPDNPNTFIFSVMTKNNHLWITTTPSVYELDEKHHFISYELDGTFRLETLTSNISYFRDETSNHYLHIPSYNVDFTKEKNINLSEITLNNILFSSISNNYIRDRNKTTYFFTGNGWSEGVLGFLYGNKNRIQSGYINYSWIQNTGKIKFHDPNSNTFSTEQTFTKNTHYQRLIGDYLVDEKSIYKFNSNSQEFIEHYNSISNTDEYRFYVNHKERDKIIVLDSESAKSWYFYIDRKDNSLRRKTFSLDPNIVGLNTHKYHVKGNYFIEQSSIYKDNERTHNVKYYNLIENDTGQDVYDIVIKSIDVHDGLNQHTITEFNYNDFKTLNDGTTYYGEVITEKKGSGNSSLGKTFNYYNTGNTDIRKIGLLERTVIKDTEDKIVQESSTEMNTSSDLFENNSENKPVFIGNRLLQNKKINHSYFYKNSLPNPNVFTTQEEYQYNENGLINKTKKTNSKGLLEEQIIEYAYENSIDFKTKNMLIAVSKRTSKINNEKVWVSLAEWANDNGKLYPNKDFKGPNEDDLRLISEITKISDKGVVGETTNGKGLYAVNLSGYNYKRSVASIDNARFMEVINNLDVSYNQLQNLNNSQLRVELIKLYNRLPNAMIKLSFYDSNGNVISEIDARQEEIKYYYDNFNRLEYVTDSNNKVLKKNIYNYKLD